MKPIPNLFSTSKLFWIAMNVPYTQLHSISCTQYTCKSTCDLMSKNLNWHYTVHLTDGFELTTLMSQAPLKSEIVVGCNHGYSKLDASDTNALQSTCVLHKTGSGWDPPIEMCYSKLREFLSMVSERH